MVLSFTKRILLWCLAAALAPLLVHHLASFWSWQATMKSEVQQRVSLVADQKFRQLEAFFAQRESDLKLVSRTPVILQTMQDLGTYRQELAYPARYSAVVQNALSFLSVFTNGSPYADALLIAPNGDLLLSLARRPELGSNLRAGPFAGTHLGRAFEQCFRTRQLVVSDFRFHQVTQRPALFILAPLFKGGSFLGVAGLEVRGQRIYELTQDFSGLGGSGETILVGLEGQRVLLLSPLRSRQYVPLQYSFPVDPASRLPLQLAAQGKRGADVRKDYRGERVVAWWNYVPRLRCGLVVQMSYAEAMAPVYRERSRVHAVAVVCLALALGTCAWAARQTARPLRALHDGVGQVAAGNWAHRVGTAAKDEVGYLSRAFDGLLDRLQQTAGSRDELHRQLVLCKKAETESRKFVLATSKTPQALLLTDRQGRIEWGNESFTRLTDFALPEVAGRRIEEVFATPETSPVTLQAIVQATQQLRSLQVELPYATKTGRSCWLQVHCQPLFDSGAQLEHWLVIATDVTDSKAAEARFGSARQESEERLRSQTSALAERTRELEQRTTQLAERSQQLAIAQQDLQRERQARVSAEARAEHALRQAQQLEQQLEAVAAELTSAKQQTNLPPPAPVEAPPPPAPALPANLAALEPAQTTLFEAQSVVAPEPAPAPPPSVRPEFIPALEPVPLPTPEAAPIRTPDEALASTPEPAPDASSLAGPPAAAAPTLTEAPDAVPSTALVPAAIPTQEPAEVPAQPAQELRPEPPSAPPEAVEILTPEATPVPAPEVDTIPELEPSPATLPEAGPNPAVVPPPEAVTVPVPSPTVPSTNEPSASGEDAAPPSRPSSIASPEPLEVSTPAPWPAPPVEPAPTSSPAAVPSSAPLSGVPWPPAPTKAQEEALPPFEFRLDEVLDRICALTGAKAAQKGLEFLFDTAPDVPPVLIGNPYGLCHILVNLIDNAVKFTAQGEVVLRTELVQEDATHVILRFAVRDTGPGLTAVQRHRLHQTFTRTDSLTLWAPGNGQTGLETGLECCKRLVDLAGGEIGVVGQLGRGSTFWFTVCLSPSGPPPHSLPFRLPAPLVQKRILVVEDADNARMVMVELLRHWGIEAVAVNSTAHALDALAQGTFHLVLLDWSLPDEDGIQAAQRLRPKGAEAPTPAVVLLIPPGRPDLLAQAHSFHLQGTLSKPFSPSRLLSALTEALAVGSGPDSPAPAPRDEAPPPVAPVPESAPSASEGTAAPAAQVQLTATQPAPPPPEPEPASLELAPAVQAQLTATQPAPPPSEPQPASPEPPPGDVAPSPAAPAPESAPGGSEETAVPAVQAQVTATQTAPPPVEAERVAPAPPEPHPPAMPSSAVDSSSAEAAAVALPPALLPGPEPRVSEPPLPAPSVAPDAPATPPSPETLPPAASSEAALPEPPPVDTPAPPAQAPARPEPADAPAVAESSPPPEAPEPARKPRRSKPPKAETPDLFSSAEPTPAPAPPPPPEPEAAPRRKRTKSEPEPAPVARRKAPVEDEPEPEAGELPARLAGVNLVEGLRRQAGNRALYRKLLLEFARQHQALPGRIREAVDENDQRTAERLVHALKDSALGLAIAEVAQAATALEAALRSHEPLLVTSAFDELEHKLAVATNALFSLEPAPPAKPPTPPPPTGPWDAPVFLRKLQMLREKVESGDADVRSLLHQLRGVSGGKFADQLEALERHVESAEFGQAADIAVEVELTLQK